MTFELNKLKQPYMTYHIVLVH